MSTFSYLACEDCQQIMGLDKYLHYYPGTIEEYCFFAKTQAFTWFMKLHPHHRLHLFTEHEDCFFDWILWPTVDWDKVCACETLEELANVCELRPQRH